MQFSDDIQAQVDALAEKVSRLEAANIKAVAGLVSKQGHSEVLASLSAYLIGSLVESDRARVELAGHPTPYAVDFLQGYKSPLDDIPSDQLADALSNLSPPPLP